MPSPVPQLFRQNKPLFRPEALREIAGFRLNEEQEAARPKLKQWAEKLRDGSLEKLNETQLLSAFIRDVFEDLLGYAGPVSGDNWTIKEQPSSSVDGKRPDAALGRFTKNDETFVAVLEGK